MEVELLKRQIERGELKLDLVRQINQLPCESVVYKEVAELLDAYPTTKAQFLILQEQLDDEYQSSIITQGEEDAMKARLIPALQFVFSSNDPTLELKVSKILASKDIFGWKLKLVLESIVEKVKESLETESENVLEFYKLGLKLNVLEIQDACTATIKKNKTKMFKNLEEFKDVCKEYPELIYKLVMHDQ